MTRNRYHPFRFFLHFIFFFTSLLFLSACNQQSATPGESETDPSTPAHSLAIPSSTPTEIPSPTLTSIPTDIPRPSETSRPTPPLEPIGGIELHSITNERGLDLLRDTNTYWIRHNALLWANIEPIEGDRNWEAAAELETELINASEQGYEVILIIRRTPLWAQAVPEVFCGPVKSEKLDAFANFIHDAVKRYSAPPYNVKFWEIGNEPDIDYKLVAHDFIFGCWGDDQDDYYGGGNYAEMLKSVYPKIKSAAPESQVLVGGLLLFCDPINPPEKSPGSGEYSDCTPSKFLEGILRNGGGDFFDGVSFHAYDYYNGTLAKYGNDAWHSSWDTTGPVAIAKVKYLRSLLGVYGYPDKFLMNTETAILCGRDGLEPECQTDEFNQTKASYAAQSFAIALAEGFRANIWFSITGWRGSGLVKGDMQPTLTSEAYKFSLQILDHAAFSRKITEYPGIQGYQFLRDGQNLWVIWGTQENPQSIELPAMPQAIYDVYGNSLPISQTIEDTTSVLYLEFAP